MRSSLVCIRLVFINLGWLVKTLMNGELSLSLLRDWVLECCGWRINMKTKVEEPKEEEGLGVSVEIPIRPWKVSPPLAGSFRTLSKPGEGTYDAAGVRKAVLEWRSFFAGHFLGKRLSNIFCVRVWGWVKGLSGCWPPSSLEEANVCPVDKMGKSCSIW